MWQQDRGGHFQPDPTAAAKVEQLEPGSAAATATATTMLPTSTAATASESSE